MHPVTLIESRLGSWELRVGGESCYGLLQVGEKLVCLEFGEKYCC